MLDVFEKIENRISTELPIALYPDTSSRGIASFLLEFQSFCFAKPQAAEEDKEKPRLVLPLMLLSTFVGMVQGALIDSLSALLHRTCFRHHADM